MSSSQQKCNDSINIHNFLLDLYTIQEVSKE